MGRRRGPGQGQAAESFLEDYAVNVSRQNDEAIANSLTATLLLNFLQFAAPKWSGTVFDLLGHLHTRAEALTSTW